MVAVKLKNQKILVSSLSAIFLLGMFSFYKASSTGIIFGAVIICGFCSAAGISLSMLFIGIRSNGPKEAARLSGMSQSVGYALAAFGPLLLGRLADISGSWSLPTLCLVVASFVMIFIGYKAGENRTVFAEKPKKALLKAPQYLYDEAEETSSYAVYLSSLQELENIKNSLSDIFQSLEDISNQLKKDFENK